MSHWPAGCRQKLQAIIIFPNSDEAGNISDSLAEVTQALSKLRKVGEIVNVNDLENMRTRGLNKIQPEIYPNKSDPLNLGQLEGDLRYASKANFLPPSFTRRRESLASIAGSHVLLLFGSTNLSKEGCFAREFRGRKMICQGQI